MNKYNQQLMDFGYFTIKDDEFLNKQRQAGKVLIGAFAEMKKAIKEGISTKILSTIAEQYILDNKCTPTFKGYKGFPETVCISINKELVHGIPKDNVFIKDGDIVKLDAGATYEGAIADMARTYCIGNNAISQKYKELIDTCEECLSNAINTIQKNSRLGDIGYAIKKTASKINANVVTEVGGHTVDYNQPHAFPFINNVGEKNKGILIREMQTYCIEPMLTYGDYHITVGDDNWTVSLTDIGVHFEDTIFVHNDFKIEIITSEK